MLIEPKEYSKIIANNLRRLAYEKGVEQKEIAEAIGVSRTIVSQWMNASRTPRMDKIDALCKYFNCSRMDIMEPCGSKRETKEITDDQAELIREEIYTDMSRPEKRLFWRTVVKEIRFDRERHFFIDFV